MDALKLEAMAHVLHAVEALQGAIAQQDTRLRPEQARHAAFRLLHDTMHAMDPHRMPPTVPNSPIMMPRLPSTVPNTPRGEASTDPISGRFSPFVTYSPDHFSPTVSGDGRFSPTVSRPVWP